MTNRNASARPKHARPTAIVFAFLLCLWATPPVQAQSLEGVSEEAIVDEAGNPPAQVEGIVSEAPVAVAAPLTVPELITDAAQRWGLPANRLLCIAFRESTYRPWVTSPGGHRGLWQWSDQTWAWASRDAGWSGSSPYDPVAATEVAAWLMSRGGWSHWSTARYC
jgi:soluble lytic murein transglycosylase-like protein